MEQATYYTCNRTRCTVRQNSMGNSSCTFTFNFVCLQFPFSNKKKNARKDFFLTSTQILDFCSHVQWLRFIRGGERK